MTAKPYPWYEFFAGGGMARLGLGPTWKCEFANELSPKKTAAYRAYFGESPELKTGDVARLTTADLPGTPTLAWASFPCQDLSLAGNGKGLQGERSGTFWPFWSLMRSLAKESRKPWLIVIENVAGAITSHGGKDFEAILKAMADEDYRFGPMVIDAARFLPQSRPRLFIVAASAGRRIPSGLVSEKPVPEWHPPTLSAAYQGLSPSLRDRWLWWNLPAPKPSPLQLYDLIEEPPAGVEWHVPEETARLLSLMSPLHRQKVAAMQRRRGCHIGAVYRRTRPEVKDGSVRRAQRAEVRFDGVSGCLRTPAGGSSRQTILVVEGQRVRSRLLSPREAARLMGAPENYPLPRNYNDAYHLFGDGLAVPVVSWLEENLLRPLAAAAQGITQAA